MIRVGSLPTGTPLKSWTVAATLSTIGGAAPRARPEPSFDPFGQAFGPLATIAVNLHLGKKRPLTFAPFGKRSMVLRSCSGAGAVGSVIVKVVRSDRLPRALCRSRLSYLPKNATFSVVTAAAADASSPAAIKAQIPGRNTFRMAAA